MPCTRKGGASPPRPSGAVFSNNSRKPGYWAPRSGYQSSAPSYVQAISVPSHHRLKLNGGEKNKPQTHALAVAPPYLYKLTGRRPTSPPYAPPRPAATGVNRENQHIA